MPRSARTQLANTWQLVWNKGLPQTPIFRESADYRLFLKLLAEITDMFRCQIYAYALLPQSCHVVIHTEHANLSQAMRYLFGKYAQHFNQTYKRQGPVFYGRFYSLIFDPRVQLLDMIKEVHLRPLRENVTTDLDTYEWCSYRWYLNPSSAPAWLNTQEVLSLFSEKQNLAVKKYSKFILEGSTADGHNGQRNVVVNLQLPPRNSRV